MKYQQAWQSFGKCWHNIEFILKAEVQSFPNWYSLSSPRFFAFAGWGEKNPGQGRWQRWTWRKIGGAEGGPIWTNQVVSERCVKIEQPRSCDGYFLRLTKFRCKVYCGLFTKGSVFSLLSVPPGMYTSLVLRSYNKIITIAPYHIIPDWHFSSFLPSHPSRKVLQRRASLKVPMMWRPSCLPPRHQEQSSPSNEKMVTNALWLRCAWISWRLQCSKAVKCWFFFRLHFSSQAETRFHLIQPLDELQPPWDFVFTFWAVRKLWSRLTSRQIEIDTVPPVTEIWKRSRLQ